MTEALLQHIWQHSLFDSAGMRAVTGEEVTVIFPGAINTNSGPDFSAARIRIGNTILVGNVELHIKASDWYKHRHEHDPAYRNLVLHVVYENDSAPLSQQVPTLVLAPHIKPHVLAQYHSLQLSGAILPCHSQLHTVKDITRSSWLTRLLAERWEEKLADWDDLLNSSAGDWRNLLYWRMAANFGFKVNADAFLMLARSLPLNILAKHHENLLQIEALLFGQAGMLTGSFNDEYPQQLQKEYQYLSQKYSLTPVPLHLWKFMRMRPANFPTIRIAQFAALVHRSVHLFSSIIEADPVKKIKELLQVKASGYWDMHYRFDDAQEAPSVKYLGQGSVNNIIINTVAPIKFLYAQHQGNGHLREAALQLLEDIPSEKNKIMDIWITAGWKPVSAAQSQAMIQLYNKYCTSGKCLQCAVGHSILRLAPLE
ncbi:MAG: DUF2851 family protein [Taibaiella sp.]|nr:DUF2851 family protein [Taibaiella sp.]